MKTPVVIGIDCSTTACKAIAWDARGEALAEGRSPIALRNPEPDAWEQDAEEWWNATIAALSACVALLDNAEIVALCVTHQRETFVVTDTAARPLGPAVVWMDSRGRDQVRRASDAIGAERLHELSGKPACITPSFYKLLHLFERQPELRKSAPRVYDVHGFIVERLTGRFVTSLAAADPLGLVDMRARTWSETLLDHAGLASGQLAELAPPGAVIGNVGKEAARRCSLPENLPVIAGAGDGQCAGLGAGIVAPGRAYLNLGTAVVSGVLSHDYRIDRAFRTLYGAAPDSYFLETDLKGGTFISSWLAERLVKEPLAALAERAAKLPPGADGLLLVPYWNGVMNPYWDDDASGITVGWHGAHGPEHLYRATIEGIALEQRLHTSGVESASGPISELIVMGGGAQSELWCQILADVLQKPITRAKTAEATALGAGILAAAAAGLHADLESAVAAMTGTAETFTPGPNASFYDRLYREAYQPLYPAVRASLAALSRLRRG